jgi:hypothetical protein
VLSGRVEYGHECVALSRTAEGPATKIYASFKRARDSNQSFAADRETAGTLISAVSEAFAPARLARCIKGRDEDVVAARSRQRTGPEIDGTEFRREISGHVDVSDSIRPDSRNPGRLIISLRARAKPEERARPEAGTVVP